jgi:hypothetical protein
VRHLEIQFWTVKILTERDAAAGSKTSEAVWNWAIKDIHRKAGEVQIHQSLSGGTPRQETYQSGTGKTIRLHKEYEYYSGRENPWRY